MRYSTLSFFLAALFIITQNLTAALPNPRYTRGNDCCDQQQACCTPQPTDCCPTVCYKPYCYYTPNYYYTCECEDVAIPCKKKCCRMVPKYYEQQCCKYEPKYYTQTYCKYEPEYYYEDDCKHCKQYHYDRHCNYEPHYYYKECSYYDHSCANQGNNQGNCCAPSVACPRSE